LFTHFPLTGLSGSFSSLKLLNSNWIIHRSVTGLVIFMAKLLSDDAGDAFGPAPTGASGRSGCFGNDTDCWGADAAAALSE
jgi:hypothetical protein